MSNSGVPFKNFYAESSRNGLTKPKAIRGQGTKMINMGEIFAHGRINGIEMDKVPLTDKEKINCLLQNGDLLFARQSLVLSGAGKCSIFLGDDEPVTFESHIIRVRLDPSKANHVFYYYYFLSPIGRSAIESIVEQGAGVAGIRGSDLGSLYVDCLPLKEQHGIASLLSVIDDKIDLNDRSNEALEAMVRLFFKDWFVDFGPIRAKAEGLPPYLASELWSLFPDVLDDEDKPMGWESSTIGQEVRVVGGSTPSTKEPAYWNGELCWATPKDLSSLKAPVLLNTERRISQAGISQISSGLLPTGTVLLSSRAPIGYLVISQVETAVNQGFIAMICEGRLTNVFTWLWTQANMDAIHQKANGSTFQEISKANFRPIPVIVADPPILRAFDEITQPLYKQIVANEQESRTLAQTRDLLLPKLMSGEIRLREAEKIVDNRL